MNDLAYTTDGWLIWAVAVGPFISMGGWLLPVLMGYFHKYKMGN